MTTQGSAAEPVGMWHGINHVTLATPDLDATVAFYRDVLGLRLVFEAPANPMHGRHAMLSPGGLGLGLHFFEVANAQIFRVPGGVPQTLEFVPGALQHIALTVADEAAALALRDRLQERGIPTTPVLTPGRNAPSARTFLFPDPSGMLIKAVWIQTGPPPARPA
jgi:catechol 2,3-dioxygenase-like lactoylglutathione lyase family enzyme